MLIFRKLKRCRVYPVDGNKGLFLMKSSNTNEEEIPTAPLASVANMLKTSGSYHV